MYLDIHLGDTAQYTLTYKLLDHNVARTIWQRFHDYNYEYVSRTQFYNWGETVEQVQANLDESIAHIKRLKPEIFSEGTDLNRLHENFPDHVHHETGELRHWLSMFNYHLHHLEDITRYQNKRFLISSASGGPGPEPLSAEDYALFSPTRLTNHLYMNYPHVGKHIMEIWSDNDIDIPAEHIVPTSVIKNDLIAWFGNNQYAQDPERTIRQVKRFCVKIANKLPHSIEDSRLALGHIQLGALTHSPDLEQIKNNQYVHSVVARSSV